ncbi:hypothetical protein IQ238_11200 [Pleurocapsales cyanobacterium LEGE 06147]|nr:hypothetical protein [Pleurocapsales cyanobacterium LEGE 06147]
MPFHVEITGKRRDTETVMRRLERGNWKSASNGNSLVAYPTSSTVLKTSRRGDFPAEFIQINLDPNELVSDEASSLTTILPLSAIAARAVCVTSMLL